MDLCAPSFHKRALDAEVEYDGETGQITIARYEGIGISQEKGAGKQMPVPFGSLVRPAWASSIE